MWHWVPSPKGRKRYPWLSATDIEKGRQIMLRLAQDQGFPLEISLLKKNKPLPKSSIIRRYLPFIDKDGLLRVSGRLQNAFISENEKHPILLSSKHHVTRLIVERAHLATMHGGSSLVQSYIQCSYLILKNRNMIRSVVRKCLKCIRHNRRTMMQQMASMPAVRLRPARPFSSTGVDYAGPFMIRCSAGRGQKSFKGYVSLLICMVTKAVDLEVVSNLTSEAFLAAFRRFVARRGLCKVMHSDNGTNFRDAATELDRLFRSICVQS